MQQGWSQTVFKFDCGPVRSHNTKWVFYTRAIVCSLSSSGLVQKKSVLKSSPVPVFITWVGKLLTMYDMHFATSTFYCGKKEMMLFYSIVFFHQIV